MFKDFAARLHWILDGYRREVNQINNSSTHRGSVPSPRLEHQMSGQKDKQSLLVKTTRLCENLLRQAVQTCQAEAGFAAENSGDLNNRRQALKDQAYFWNFLRNISIYLKLEADHPVENGSPKLAHK